VLNILLEKMIIRKKQAKGYFFLFIFSLAFYLYTLAPDVLWNDSPIFQLRIFLGDYIGNLGLALSHPLYIFIGKLFSFLPFGNMAYKANLVSAVFGALTVSNIFLLLRKWNVDYQGAVLASLTLMVCHTFWFNSVIAEVYTLYTFLFLIELILLTQYLEMGQKKYLFCLFLVNGLNISNHLLALLNFVVYFIFSFLLFLRHKITRRDFFFLCLTAFFGALPYEILIIKDLFHSHSFVLTLQSAFVGNSAWGAHVFNTRFFSVRNFKNFLLFLGMNFPVFHIYFAALGLKRIWKGWNVGYRTLFGGIFLINFLFAFRYTVADQYVFYLPVYIFVVLGIGLGLNRDRTRKSCRAVSILLFFSVISPVFIYQHLPHLVNKYNIDFGVKREISYRDHYKYYLNPSKRNDYSARKYALHVARQTEKGSIIIPDYTIINTLLYFQRAEGIGHDYIIGIRSEDSISSTNLMKIYSTDMINILGKHKVYVTSDLAQYTIAWIVENFCLRKEGILYRVFPPKNT